MPTTTIKRLVKQAPEDKSSKSFQQFIYDFFTKKSKYRPPAHANLVGEGNRCASVKRLNKRGQPIRDIPKLSLHQAAVSTIMKVLAYNPENTNRGLLAWHSTGSGKTLTATAIMDAFWDTNKHIIYVSSVEGKAANPPTTFYSNARKYLQRFKSRRFSNPDIEITLSLVGEEFKKRDIKFMTFAQLAHFLLISKPLQSVQDPVKKAAHKNYLDNAIIIIDEVHNIFKPLPNQREECNALRKFLMDPNNPHTSNTKIVVLTATPGDSPQDIIDLLNMVRDRHKPVITVPNTDDPASLATFKESVQGLVSFFDMSGDMTKFPKVINEPNVTSHMSEQQFNEYAKAYIKSIKNPAQNNFNTLAIKNKTKKYMEYARKYSNMMYKVDNGAKVAEFSAKMADLISNIQKYPDEKHYIYSSFFSKHGFGGQGILAIARVLKEQLGFQQLKPKEVNNELVKTPSLLENGKRFIVATTPMLTETTPNAGKNLKKLIEIFNSSVNIKGQKVQIFLASQGYNEGIDLRGVRHIHIFDPLVTVASEKQTIGRAARHCSHSDLSLTDNEWLVKIHRYYSVFPIDLERLNTEQIKNKLQEMEAEIQKQLDSLNVYRKSKDQTAIAARNNIKHNIVELKSKRRNIQKELKKAEQLNLQNVQEVDMQIRREALERMKHLETIYQILYDTAVDCLLFKDFHSLAGYNITCQG